MSTKKNKRITIRMSSQDIEWIDYAAMLTSKCRQQFILDAAIEEAERTLQKSQPSNDKNKFIPTDILERLTK